MKGLCYEVAPPVLNTESDTDILNTDILIYSTTEYFVEQEGLSKI